MIDIFLIAERLYENFSYLLFGSLEDLYVIYRKVKINPSEH
ncbi:hypothetical protein RV14_GL001495 [Enterococcus ratti]|uniref:Uncharacterized protein n=1 Tax=Enterococcus ratti TaxID=150033 RepID=A0A1L8W9Z4_9ENTE|nr:hypothetical protein RV14_GL001495 [Enterococcus ratti]